MSEPTTEAPKTTEAATSTEVPPQIAIRQEVTTRLGSSGPQVKELVIADMTAKEIENRRAATMTVLGRIEEKQKELKKLENGGSYTYSATGEKVGTPAFTKDQAEKMKKLREEIVKLQAALTQAFTDSNFQKLLELAKQGGSAPSKPDAEPGD